MPELEASVGLRKTQSFIFEQCRLPRSAAQWRDRILLLRQFRETRAKTSIEAISVGLLESAYRQPLRNLKPAAQVDLFLHALRLGAWNEAELLAVTAQGGATRLAMWSKLDATHPTQVVTNELARARTSYPAVAPADLVARRRRSSGASFPAYVASVATHPDRYSWKHALAAILRTQPRRAEVEATQWEHASELWEASRNNCEPLLKRLNKDVDVVALGRVLVEAGKAVPSALHAGPDGVVEMAT